MKVGCPVRLHPLKTGRRRVRNWVNSIAQGWTHPGRSGKTGGMTASGKTGKARIEQMFPIALESGPLICAFMGTVHALN